MAARGPRAKGLPPQSSRSRSPQSIRALGAARTPVRAARTTRLSRRQPYLLRVGWRNMSQGTSLNRNPAILAKPKRGASAAAKSADAVLSPLRRPTSRGIRVSSRLPSCFRSPTTTTRFSAGHPLSQAMSGRCWTRLPPGSSLTGELQARQDGAALPRSRVILSSGWPRSWCWGEASWSWTNTPSLSVTSTSVWKMTTSFAWSSGSWAKAAITCAASPRSAVPNCACAASAAASWRAGRPERPACLCRSTSAAWTWTTT
mmetsp:Transcript_68708/g.123834  ORF Transcript_68708/g.123834 Transcript_68708/m.123834 type:complete len:259 (+) Transcript_68708:1009-1785(+)